MAIELSEEEMRKALFGATADPVIPKQTTVRPETSAAPVPPAPASSTRRSAGYRSSKLRVTLHVSKVYEGEVDIFIHESSSLSRLVAEQEAKAAAKKQKYKYLELASIEAVSK
ncbi:hypothetical protein LT706_12260 [Pseudomonas syringae pv. syringae]|uniref:hypothetical protein n=1 Tax=Pseudomonas syringae TaxID=317 RepID=UPI00200B5473|nr:hypothetical protein [Pseudomonas syringae]MCK9712296.1 hypothetical protein [Pseudomonas syringae pv. syringae]